MVIFRGLVSLTLVDFILFSTGAVFVPTAAVKSATGPCRALLIGSRPLQFPGLLGIFFGLVVVDFSHNLAFLDPSRCCSIGRLLGGTALVHSPCNCALPELPVRTRHHLILFLNSNDRILFSLASATEPIS